ncbi:hypothetical protein LJC61_02245 [Ruminococcaceae bacterium OttesenSCG-928-A16]|nr:hypothetical protein [Ruminococcaceae bacterium OttesenSCG-928-A16]
MKTKLAFTIVSIALCSTLLFGCSAASISTKTTHEEGLQPNVSSATISTKNAFSLSHDFFGLIGKPQSEVVAELGYPYYISDIDDDENTVKINFNTSPGSLDNITISLLLDVSDNPELCDLMNEARRKGKTNEEGQAAAYDLIPSDTQVKQILCSDSRGGEGLAWIFNDWGGPYTYESMNGVLGEPLIARHPTANTNYGRRPEDLLFVDYYFEDYNIRICYMGEEVGFRILWVMGSVEPLPENNY